jgi:uncharacterized membrane protein
VQPEISDNPANAQLAGGEPFADSAQEPARNSLAYRISKSDGWLVLGVIGLILTGMLLGAEIMRLWISHAAPANPQPIVLLLLDVLAKALL